MAENNPSDREEMRKLFHEAYSKWKSDKEDNRLSIKSDVVYNEIIETFRKKACGRQLSTKEYNWLSRFECVWLNGKEVLQHKRKTVIKESSLFNLLYDVHLNLGHSGRDGMLHELK
uniref:Integrase zinc-binding domain-containing protein n=1 Tax=Panagrolaimus superbus TaxID=310955 RepID=A0A914YB34_9BILA